MPIGNLTSQLFANAFLNEADHFAKRVLKIPLYIRYMDDMAVFGSDQRAVRRQAAALIDWLARERRLEARCKGAPAMRTTGAFTWLGYTVDREKRRISGPTLRRMRGRLKGAAREGDDIEGRLHAELRGLLF